MNRTDPITRLKAADPAAGRQPVVDLELARVRVEAIEASVEPDALTATAVRRARLRDGSRRPRVRRLATVGIALLALPAAALAATALTGADEVERALPDGAHVLNGTNPRCVEAETRAVFECTLTTPPPTPVGEGAAESWLDSVSLLADRDEQVSGGCVAQRADGLRWRCYLGRAAADEWILDARLLGRPLDDRCVHPLKPKPGQPATVVPGGAPPVNPDGGLNRGAGPTADQSSHAIVLCATRGTFQSVLGTPDAPPPPSHR
jgi:hypothetical protein